MTLPASGSISLSQVNTELSKSATATISLNDTDVRTLAGIASGTISLASLWGKAAEVTKGYWAGGSVPGSNSTYTADIAGITFSNETLFDPSAALSVARAGNTGFGSTTKAYWGGGRSTNSTGASTNEIDGLLYSTQTAINPSATLATTRSSPGSTYSGTKGYWCGGDLAETVNPITKYAEIDGLIFSTDAAHNPSAALSVAKSGGPVLTSSSKGYLMFGTDGGSSFIATTDALVFTTETCSAISAQAPLQYYYPATAYQSSTTGYLGSSTGIGSAGEAFKFTFSSETFASLTTGSVPAYDANICLCNKTTGYTAGGTVLAQVYPQSIVYYYNTIFRYTFSTETSGSVSATLPDTRTGNTGVNGY